MNEELDSQLSAMFDDELPPAECELLARRLSRDEQLKARWGRYAVVGACIRAERGVRLNCRAGRAGERRHQLRARTRARQRRGARPPRRLRWWQPLAGGRARGRRRRGRRSCGCAGSRRCRVSAVARP